jgi:hypothetical protein
MEALPLPPPKEQPQWFDPLHTQALAKCLPNEPNVDEPHDNLSPSGWLKIHITHCLPSELMTPLQFKFIEAPPKLREAKVNAIKRHHGTHHDTLSFNQKINGEETNHCMFLLRLQPTTKQKWLFQRAFSIAHLAKKLVYQQIGDQCLPLPKKFIAEIKQAVCTERIQHCKQVRPDDKANMWMKLVGCTDNETLPPYTWRVLFEQHLPKKERLLANVRTNAVIKFCQAINTTQAAMEEKTLVWDWHMEAHQCWLDQQQQ